MNVRLAASVIACAALAAAGPAILTGCESARQVARDQARMDIRSFRAELNRMPGQIDRTINVLGDLTSEATTNREAVFAQFGRELGRMQEHGRSLSRQADLATRNSERYFRAWAEELRDADDPTDRAQGEAALRARTLKFDTALQYLTAGRNEFRRVLADMEAINSELTGNLTNEGIASVSGRAQTLIGHSVALRNTVDRMTEQIDSSLAGQ